MTTTNYVCLAIVLFAVAFLVLDYYPPKTSTCDSKGAIPWISCGQVPK